MNSRKFLFLLIMFFFVLHIPAQSSFSVNLEPGVSIPLAVSGENTYKTGFSGTLNGRFKIDEDSLLTLGGGLFYNNTPTRADELSINLIGLGIGPGIDLPLLQFMNLNAALDLGWYLGFRSESITQNPFGAVSAGFNFRLNPQFSLGLRVSYQYYLTVTSRGPEPLYQGIGITLGAGFSPGARVRPADIDIPDIRFLPVFPVFHKYYNDNPLGFITLRNNEKKPISDIEVSLLVSEYMDAPRVCSRIESLGAGEEVEVPLYALFNMDIMELTEKTMTNARFQIHYRWKGEEMSLESSEAMEIQNRNAMIWDDDRKAASFVTAGDPFVLQFAKNVGGLVRESSQSPINLNFRIAMGIFEALNDYGINYVVDPLTPYTELSGEAMAVDYLQFPRHTLTYKAGDCDDLSILYSSLLKAVGMRTAFVTIPGHIFMAFQPGMSREELRRTLKNTGDFIEVDGEIWVPVEITQVQAGFLNAWQTGAKEWREHEPRGNTAFFPIDAAQEIYEPVGLRGESLELDFPEDDEILSSYQTAIIRFVSQEISDDVERLQARIDASGGNARNITRLGVLYARYGLYEKARAEFEKAVAQQEYPSAIINLGNICFIEGDYSGANEWFSRASAAQPDNPAIIVGMARTNYELENYAVVNRLYDKLITLDPEAAERYSYLVLESSDENRASGHDFIDMLWSGEEE